MKQRVTVAVVAGLALVVMVAMLWLLQRRLIYFPSQALPPIASLPSPVQEVQLRTRDGLTLNAWFLPSTNARGITFIVFNGNAGNRADRLPLGTGLTERGFDVLLVDYRGYGGNPGSPTETGLAQDAVAAVQHLEQVAGLDPGRIVYFGESLGAAVAVGLAPERPPALLILRSPFTSLPAVAASHYPFLPVSTLLRDRYDNLSTIPGVDVPLMVVAGTNDRIVPFSQSREVFDAARGPKEFVSIDGADHNDPVLTSGDEMLDRIEAFVLEHLDGASPRD